MGLIPEILSSYSINHWVHQVSVSSAGWQLSLGTQMRPPWQLLARCAHLNAPKRIRRSRLGKLNAEWRSWCYGIKVRASKARKFSATTLASTYGDSQVVSPTTWNLFQNPYQGLSRGIAFLARNLATGSRACSRTLHPTT